MSAVKLFGNWLMCLGIACWVMGCQEEEVTPLPASTTGNTPSTVGTPPGHAGHEDGEEEEGHSHDGEEEEGHSHDEGEDEDNDGDVEIDTDGDDETDVEVDVEPDADGDAQSSTDALEIPEGTNVGADDSPLDLPNVETGSTTGV